MAHRVPLLALVFAAALSAGEPASPPAAVVVLTVDNKLLEGQLAGFDDGYLLLRPKEGADWKLSPDCIDGVFASREEAEAARDDPDWPRKLLGLEPERPSRDADRPAPGTEEGRERLTVPPPGGDPLEETYFAAAAPTEKAAEDRFFHATPAEAQKVAGRYRELGLETLERRMKTLSPMLAGSGRNPRTLLSAELYRPVLLHFAMIRESLELLFEAVRDNPRLRKRKAESDRARLSIAGYLLAQAEAIEKSDLSKEERAKAKARLQVLCEMILQPGS